MLTLFRKRRKTCEKITHAPAHYRVVGIYHRFLNTLSYDYPFSYRYPQADPEVQSPESVRREKIDALKVNGCLFFEGTRRYVVGILVTGVCWTSRARDAINT